MADSPTDLHAERFKKLKLSGPVQAALSAIHAELAEAYRDSFVNMIHAIEEQASALRRIQETLAILVQHVAPTIAAQAPVAFRIAADGEEPDLTAALVVADPIGQGFTLSQTTLAQTLGVSVADLGVAIKALKLNADPECAVVVRTGKRSQIVNYHRRAIDKFRAAVMAAHPSSFDGNNRSAIRRLQAKLGSSPQ